MHPAVVLLLVGILDAVTARPDTPSPWDICGSYDTACGDGWSYVSDHYCLKYFKAPKTFQEAQDHCVSLGGDLVSMHNDGEMYEVLCFTWFSNPELQKFWIGATGSGGEFKDMDGSPLDYTRWRDGQPDNAGGHEDCVESNFEEWGCWNDAVCSKERPYVCAKTV